MKKMKDSCFNEFDPNAMSVEAALESILKSISSIKTVNMLISRVRTGEFYQRT